jgi:putative Mg2+ transporter-C (MgtC) family protein
MEEPRTLTLLFGVLPDGDQVLRVCARLAAALVLGAIIGWQRELMGKPAGLRTHALVTLAAAIFTLGPIEVGMQLADLSRVIQGIATGIGFIGAGVILKRQAEGEVLGLTTAATIWTATAVGVTVGLGHVVLAAIGVALTWLVLTGFSRVDQWVSRRE